MRKITLLGLLLTISTPVMALDKDKALRYQTAVINNQGEQLGVADLEETNNGVLMTLDLKNMGKESWRAVHFHEKADCTPFVGNPEGKGPFTNTGGHFNPHGHSHGYHHGDHAHAGDMPNLYVHDGGVLKVKVLNTFVTLMPTDQGGRAPLFDKDGSALIIHEGTDDYMSQPTGEAGGRFACAVITNQEHSDRGYPQPVAGKHDHGHDHDDMASE